jgi:hypothetical protein
MDTELRAAYDRRPDIGRLVWFAQRLPGCPAARSRESVCG